MTEEKKPQGAQKVQEAQKAQEPKPARKARKADAAPEAQEITVRRVQKAVAALTQLRLDGWITEEEAQAEKEALLKTASAQLTGKPIEQLTLAESIAALADIPIEEAAKQTADDFLSDLSLGQLEQIQALLEQNAQGIITRAQDQIKGAMDAQRESLRYTAAALKEYATAAMALTPEVKQRLAELAQAAQEAYIRLTQPIVTKQLDTLFKNLQLFGEAFSEIDAEKLQSNLEEAQALLPYMKAALEEAQADPEAAERYAGITAADIIDLLELSTKGVFAPEKYAPLLERAKELKAEAEKPAEQTTEEQPEQREREEQKKRRAQKGGAIISFGNRAAYLAPGKDIPEKALQALQRTCLFVLPKETDKAQVLDEKTGQMNPLYRRPEKQLEEAHTGLFGCLMNIVLQSYTPETQERNSVKVYIPALLEYLKVDPRTYSQRREKRPISELRAKKMLELLQPFDDVVGMLPDGSFYRFLTFSGYDAEDETMEIIMPFLFELARRYDERRYNFLMHSDAANERNQAAVEVAVELLRGLVRRGTRHPDANSTQGEERKKKRKTTTKKANGDIIIDETTYSEPQQLSLFTEENQPRREAVFSYEISYGSIVDRCPQLQKALADIEAEEKQTLPDGTEKEPVKMKRQAINSKLKQVFTAAFRILLEKTDAPKYYKNLHFANVYPDGSYILPTRSTLYSKKIKLVYNGKNRDYKRN